jgi:hypothetical protein
VTKVLQSVLAIWRRLRLTMFGGARMSATTIPSTSLSPVGLETGAPEFGPSDLTEFRTVIRPFPKDEAERDCYQYLLKQMQAAPDRPPAPKVEFENDCRWRFDVTAESFEYCWREAIKATGANWDQPGRRPKINSRTKPLS